MEGVRTVLKILYVEDSDDQFILVRECLKRVEPKTTLHHVGSGRDCLAFLHKEGDFLGAPDVDVILLDLRMPGLSGLEVLERIATNQTPSGAPVVMFTTSSLDQDIQRAYELRCAGYIVKPFDFDRSLAIFEQFAKYWTDVVSFPRPRPAAS
jgi:CheY-like chemotaxis protein